MFIIRLRKIFFTISALAVAVSIFAVAFYGFNFGIDFKGGSLLEVTYETARPSVADLTANLDKVMPGAQIQLAGEKDVFVRTRDLTDEEHTTVLNALTVGESKAVEKRFNSIGPVIGKELRSKAWMAITAVILGIMLFIAFAFRKVSQPISSWKYGLVTTISLVHDILIPTGIFVYLGKEVNSLFVVALLSILGISVHDKIVVFDRVRENLRLRLYKEFSETVGKSLEQTFARSINTSLTILAVLFALFYFGPETTRDFSLLLFIGVAIGTYSSIFFGAPLLVWLEKLQIGKGKK
jgi:preprotein translocase subunit SecF